MLKKRARKLRPAFICRHLFLYLTIITALLHPGRILAVETGNNGDNRSRQNQVADFSDNSWQITADKITRYAKPDRIVAEGNVVLYPREKEGADKTVLKADRLTYNRSEGKVTALGNIRLKREGQDLTAEQATLYLETKEASFSEATLYIPRHQLHFSSRRIDKESAGDIYHFAKGSYTTCPIEEGKNPPWHLNTGKGTLNLDGIGHLSNTVLRIKGLPVLYIPYLPIPIFQERQTGFLLPELSSSRRSGIGISAPYFINLSPSSDTTLYPGFLSRRGPALGAEFRYFADYESKSILGFSYLSDRTEDTPADDYKSDDYLRLEENRYWLWGKVDHDFGNRLFARVDLDIVSDQDYLQEFENSISRYNDVDEQLFDWLGRGFEEPSLPYRSSRLNLGKTWDSSFLGGRLIGIDDNDYLTSSDEQVHTLPHLILAGSTPFHLIPVHLNWDTDYVNYLREEGVGEERLDLHPRLISSLPFLPPQMEGIFSAGLRETIYNIHSYGDSTWENEKRQFRTAWDIKTETGTTLVRDFDVSLGSWKRLSHTFRPEAAYNYRFVKDDDTLPVLDNDDSLSDINEITYSLNNYFRAGGADSEGKPFENYLGYVKILQSYDIKEARRDLEDQTVKRRPFSDISLRMDIYPLPHWELKFKSAYSVYGEGFTNYDLFTRYTTDRGDKVSLDYRFQKNSSINEINAEVETKLTDTIYFQGEIKQSLETNETVSSSLSLIYHPQCWALKFSMENTPDDERIAVVLSLVGFGDSLGIGLTGDLADNGGMETTLEGNVLEQ